MLYRGNLRTIVIFAALASAFLPLSPTYMVFGLCFLAVGCVFRYFTKATLIRDSVLCRDGLYRMVRHPYYLGNFVIDSSLCLLSGNMILVYAYPFLFFWAYGPAFRKEEQFLFERYPEDYLDYLLSTPQVLPSSHVRARVAEVLQTASPSRVTNKEFARILSAWASAILIILAHRLLVDGYQLFGSHLQEPFNLGLGGLVAVLFIFSFVLHRKRKLNDVLEDFSELLGKLQRTPEAVRKDPSTQEVIDRIKSTLDGYGRYNVYVNQCGRFFDEFIETLQQEPGQAACAEQCNIVQLIEQTFEDAKKCQIATYSTRKTRAVDRAKQFSYTLSVEGSNGQTASNVQAVDLKAEGKPTILSFAFHELARIAILRGDASVCITVIPDVVNDQEYYRVRYSTVSRRALPSPDELRSTFFSPRKHTGGSLGSFLIRHFFRSFYQGDFDLIDAEVPQGRLVLELTFPKEFKPGVESAPRELSVAAVSLPAE